MDAETAQRMAKAFADSQKPDLKMIEKLVEKRANDGHYRLDFDLTKIDERFRDAAFKTIETYFNQRRFPVGRSKSTGGPGDAFDWAIITWDSLLPVYDYGR